MRTWSMIMELVIFTLLPMTQPAPIADLLMDERSPI